MVVKCSVTLMLYSLFHHYTTLRPNHKKKKKIKKIDFQPICAYWSLVPDPLNVIQTPSQVIQNPSFKAQSPPTLRPVPLVGVVVLGQESVNVEVVVLECFPHHAFPLKAKVLIDAYCLSVLTS